MIFDFCSYSLSSSGALDGTTQDFLRYEMVGPVYVYDQGFCARVDPGDEPIPSLTGTNPFPGLKEFDARYNPLTQQAASKG